MSAPDRSYFDILTQLEEALGEIESVSACLIGLREADSDQLHLAAGYLGDRLGEHRQQANDAFNELFDRLVKGDT